MRIAIFLNLITQFKDLPDITDRCNGPAHLGRGPRGLQCSGQQPLAPFQEHSCSSLLPLPPHPLSPCRSPHLTRACIYILSSMESDLLHLTVGATCLIAMLKELTGISPWIVCVCVCVGVTAGVGLMEEASPGMHRMLCPGLCTPVGPTSDLQAHFQHAEPQSAALCSPRLPPSLSTPIFWMVVLLPLHRPMGACSSVSL